MGPFNAFVHVPRIGIHLTHLGKALRFESSLDARTLELVVLTVGSHWRSEFEWWAHTRLAQAAGISEEVIDAISRDEEPPVVSTDERAVQSFARELLKSGRVDERVYRDAHAVVGDQGLVEIVSLCGYYTLISFILNAFEVPLPPGADPRW